MQAESPSSTFDSLPFEVLLNVAHNLPSPDRRRFSLASSLLSSVAAETCEALHVTDNMAQHVLNDRPSGSPRHSPTWMQGLLSRHPRVRVLRVGCHAGTLAVVLTNLLQSGEGAVDRVLGFARAAQEPRHAAAMYVCLAKHYIFDAKIPLAMNMISVMERLVEPARSDEEAAELCARGYASCRNVMNLVCLEACRVLQHRHAAEAFLFAKKVGDPCLAAATWSELLCFLVGQGHLTETIEGLAITPDNDRGACGNEVLRRVIDAAIVHGFYKESLMALCTLYTGPRQLTLLVR